MTPWRIWIGLMLLTIVVYLPHALIGDWVYEDTNTEQWLSQSLNPMQMPSRVVAQWTVNLIGPDVQSQHAANLALHLLNGWLLTVFLIWMGLPPRAVLCAVGLFWLHPIQVETVAYVTERTELLSLCGILLAVACTAMDQWWSLLGILAGGVLAMASKETGVCVVVLVPLVAWMRRLDHAPALLSIAVFALFVWMLPGAVRLARSPALWIGSGWPDRFHNLIALSRYLELVVIPVGFSIDHGFQATSIWSVRTLLTVDELLIAVVVLWNRRIWANRLLVGAMVWIVASIALRFVIAIPDLLTEHQTYTPFVGVWLGLGTLIGRRP